MRVLQALLPSLVMVGVFIAVIVTLVRHSDGIRPGSRAADGPDGRSSGRPGGDADGGLPAGSGPQNEQQREPGGTTP